MAGPNNGQCYRELLKIQELHKQGFLDVRYNQLILRQNQGSFTNTATALRRNKRKADHFVEELKENGCNLDDNTISLALKLCNYDINAATPVLCKEMSDRKPQALPGMMGTSGGAQDLAR